MPRDPATHPIALDCDVLFGVWPPRADLDLSVPAGQQRLARAGITGALACSGRGAWFDDVTGNDETIEVGRQTGWLPAGTINLRNALRAVAELDRLVAAGVRAVRLFGPLQGCEPHFPGYLHIVEEAVRRDLLLLVEGDVRQVWEPFAGRGAKVVFLDVHAYHLADFVLLARREPHFVASNGSPARSAPRTWRSARVRRFTRPPRPRCGCGMPDSATRNGRPWPAAR
jgi:hypothetical protein